MTATVERVVASTSIPTSSATDWWRLNRHSLPIVVVLAIIGSLAFVRRTDPDFWWHLQAGRDMLSTASIPRVDSYSHTMAGMPWVAHSWLWEALLAGIHDQLGYVGVSALLSGLLVVTFGLLYHVLRARGLVEWAAAATVLAAALMSVQTLTARPHAVTYLCIAITIVLLDRWRAGHERLLWWFVPTAIVWVNVHGGYAIGLALLGLTLLGELMDARLDSRSPRVHTLLAVLVAGLLASSINPQGPGIHLFAAGFLSRDSAMQRYIQEWASPDFHDWPGMIMAASLLMIAVVGLRPRRVGWVLIVPAIVCLWQALQSVRHIPLYALVTLPAAVPALVNVVPAVKRRPRLPESARFAVVNWVAAMVFTLAVAVPVLANPMAQTKLAALEEWYPTDGLAYLRTHRPPGPLFNFDGWGGYLIARAPDYPVYIDGRTDLYGRQHLEEYRQVARLEPGWQATLDNRGIRLVLVQHDSPLAGALRSDEAWELLVDGQVESLFARR